MIRQQTRQLLQMRTALQRSDMTMMQIRRRNQTLMQTKVHLERKVMELKRELFLAREASPADRLRRLMDTHPRMLQMVMVAAVVLALAAALVAALAAAALLRVLLQH